MKTKFNKFERVAGIFVLSAVAGGITLSIAVGIKRGWFENRVSYQTTIENADGIREGCAVQIAGLRAGEVTDVELQAHGVIHVKFEVSEKFREHLREDSVLRVMRPFLIGEKVLDITLGSDERRMLNKNGIVKSEPAMDLMDLMSGRTLGPQLALLGKMSENLRFVAESFADPNRSRAFISLFDELTPLAHNMNGMSKEAMGLLKTVNHDKELVRTIHNLTMLTDQMNKMLPIFEKDSPQLAHDLAKIARNTAILTDELQKTMPAIANLAPEIPHASQRALEALDETVVTLKALQKSFLLRGNVKDVRDEEAARENQRLPASTNPETFKKGVK